jgi:hypothetical protein
VLMKELVQGHRAPTSRTRPRRDPTRRRARG